MTSEWQFSLLPERRDQARSALDRLESTRGVATHLVDGVQAQVGQFALLGVTEQVLDGIELGGVGRKPLQHDPVAERLDIGAHETAAVGRQTVPDDQQLALDLAGQRLQVLDELRRLDGTVKETEVSRSARTSPRRRATAASS